MLEKIQAILSKLPQPIKYTLGMALISAAVYVAVNYLGVSSTDADNAATPPAVEEVKEKADK